MNSCLCIAYAEFCRCFCHKNTIDMGYICSVCLSIFCKHHKKCSTCGWDWDVPTLQCSITSSADEFWLYICEVSMPPPTRERTVDSYHDLLSKCADPSLDRLNLRIPHCQIGKGRIHQVIDTWNSLTLPWFPETSSDLSYPRTTWPTTLLQKTFGGSEVKGRC